MNESNNTASNAIPSKANPGKAAPIRNTNRWDTKTMVTMALLAALGALLSFVEGGNFGGFLNYDASFVPAMIGALVFGPVPGAVIGVISWVIHVLIKADFWGSLMNMIAVACYVVPAGLYYAKHKTRQGAIVALALGLVTSVAAMIVMNLLVTPIYTGMPMATVAQWVVPLLLPFNICKAAVNSVLTFLLYKPVSNMVKPAKEQKSA